MRSQKTRNLYLYQKYLNQFFRNKIVRKSEFKNLSRGTNQEN